MNILGRKKKKSSSLPSLKTLSAVTGVILALNKAIKDKVPEQRYYIADKKKKTRNESGTIAAGFIGGVVAGAITALLLAPESGEDLRRRVGGMVGSGNGYDEDAIIEEARQKAQALAAQAKTEAEQAEKGLQDN
ncbi:MAG: YtxH domain-containing protein [Tunicatimonas sp.]